jgi:hypothetical protein
MVVRDTVEKCDIHSYHYYGKLQVKRCLDVSVHAVQAYG